MVCSKKKRKVDDENRAFNHKWALTSSFKNGNVKHKSRSKHTIRALKI